MKLSILICSLESRAQLLNTLWSYLETQRTPEVEIIANTDNREKTTGKKRQELLEEAKGEYITYIDDDDWIPSYYIQQMLIFCNTGLDCAAINGTMTTDGKNEIKWYISKDFQNETRRERGRHVYHRKTNHITAVKRELALKAGFPDISNGEDKIYSEALNPYLKTEYKIIKPMYWYRFSSFNKQYK